MRDPDFGPWDLYIRGSLRLRDKTISRIHEYLISCLMRECLHDQDILIVYSREKHS